MAQSQCVHVHKHSTKVRAISSGLGFIVTGANTKGRILVQENNRHQVSHILRGDGIINSICVIAADNPAPVIAAGTEDGTIPVWQLPTVERAEDRRAVTDAPNIVLRGHEGSVTCVYPEPGEGTRICSASRDGTVKLWHPFKLCVDHAHTVAVGCGKAAWENKKEAGRLKIRDLREQGYFLDVKSHKREVSTVKWNPEDTDYIATGAADGIVKLWDLRNMEAPVISNIELGIKKEVCCIDWWGDDQVLALGTFILSSYPEDLLLFFLMLWKTLRMLWKILMMLMLWMILMVDAVILIWCCLECCWALI